MADFKKLSAVDMVETVSDAATVLIEEHGVIKRVPKDEVGGIKVAYPAEVGQTIVVKAVDENGMPTEWECADMGGSGGGHWVMYGTDAKITASEGIYEALEKLLDDGIPVCVTTFFDARNYDAQNFQTSIGTNIRWNGNNKEYIVVDGVNDIMFYIYKNGNHEYFWD